MPLDTHLMTPARALAIVVSSGALFSILGGGVGYALGRLAPNYYRNLYEDGHSRLFDPVEMGIGLGTTQGLVCGAIVGLLIVAVLVWQSTRLKTPG